MEDAIEKKKQEDKRKQEQADQKKAQEELNRRREELNASARAASGEFSADAGKLNSSGKEPKLAKELGKFGVGLSDGANENEIDRIAAEFKQATKDFSGATLDALKGMLEEMQKQGADIRKLQGQKTKDVPK